MLWPIRAGDHNLITGANDLEVDPVRTTHDEDVIFSLDSLHRMAATREKMFAVRTSDMRLGERPKEVKRGGAHRPIVRIWGHQHIVIDAKLDTRVSAKILRVVGSSVEPMQICRTQNDHDGGLGGGPVVWSFAGHAGLCSYFVRIASGGRESSE